MNHTSIEESAKLVELGLNAETADMCWMGNTNDPHIVPCPFDATLMHANDENFIYAPCWSTDGLMAVIASSCDRCETHLSVDKQYNQFTEKAKWAYGKTIFDCCLVTVKKLLIEKLL